MEDVLEQKLNIVKERIPKEKWQYFHIESLQNFILHVNSISNIRTKERVIKEIDSYLSLVMEVDFSTIDEGIEYKKNYSGSIYKIGQLYADELGFISKPYYPIVGVIFVLLMLVAIYFFNIKLAFLFIAAPGVVYFFYLKRKVQLRKFY